MKNKTKYFLWISVIIIFLLLIGLILFYSRKTNELTINTSSNKDEPTSQTNQTNNSSLEISNNMSFSFYDNKLNLVCPNKPKQVTTDSKTENVRENYNSEEYASNYFFDLMGKWKNVYFDVDNDGNNEEIKTAWTAMNHGPHELRIVKNGITIFKASGANIDAFENNDKKGFLLLNIIDWNEGSYKITYFSYNNQKFIPIWVQEDCLNTEKKKSLFDEVISAVEKEDVEKIIKLHKTTPFDCKQGLETDKEEDSPLKDMVKNACGSDRLSTVNVYTAGYFASEGFVLLEKDYREMLTKLFQQENYIFDRELTDRANKSTENRIIFINSNNDFPLGVDLSEDKISGIIIPANKWTSDQINNFIY